MNLTFEVPGELYSTQNTGRWQLARRTANLHSLTTLTARNANPSLPVMHAHDAPARVTIQMTRVYCGRARRFGTDTLTIACKGVRDALAGVLFRGCRLETHQPNLELPPDKLRSDPRLKGCGHLHDDDPRLIWLPPRQERGAKPGVKIEVTSE